MIFALSKSTPNSNPSLSRTEAYNVCCTCIFFRDAAFSDDDYKQFSLSDQLINLCCNVIQQWRMYRMKKLFLSSLAALLVVSLAAEEEDSKSKKDSVGTVIGIDLGTTYSW